MLLAFLDFNPVTLLILGTLAVLLFGERLPEVARAFGRQLMELKKGMSGIESEIRNAVNSATTSINTPPVPRVDQPVNREEATAPKFEPPPAEPKLGPTSAEPPSESSPSEPPHVPAQNT